ncbi:MAG TPA: PAS domain S-box protein [Steroidobacteraceae bacterium]|nr:PAS domain S-box protein [Steroidobacteraceae bacterium]
MLEPLAKFPIEDRAVNARRDVLLQAERAILAAVGDHTAQTGNVGAVLHRLVEQTESRLRRVSRLYAVSSSVNEAIVRVRDPQELYRSACRIAVEQGEVKLAWIGVLNPESGKLELAARFGGNEAFIDRVFARIRSAPTSPGPAGRALRDGSYAVANDIATDATFYVKDDALKLGLRACGVFPLKAAGVVRGIMALYADQTDYFADEELRVLNALADDISFAVESAAQQRALNESERILATLFANLPGMAYRRSNDANWTALFLSEGCEALTGYTSGELLENRSACYERVIYPLDREAVRTAVDAAIAKRKPYEMVYRLVTKQGQVKWIWERGGGIFDGQGELRFLEGFVTDVTAQREAEAQVAAQAALLDKATDAIVLYGLDDIVYYWNDGATRLYGWSTQEVIGRKITELTCRDTEQRRALVAKVIQQGEWRGELTQFSKSVKEVVVDASWTLVRDDFGTPRSILAINTDVTQQKKMEAQFLTTQRLESIGTLAGGIAHDFNNILAAISGNVKFVINQLADHHPLQTHLREIEKASRRATELVRQILTFSRNQAPQRQIVKLNDIVAEALRLLRATLPAQIEIRATYAEDAPDISADPTQMHQVVVNLGTNAAHAMRERGGKLTVDLAGVTVDANAHTYPSELRPGRYACLTMSDTGVGMDNVTLERIFEPFFTTKAPGHGTGLGLSVVHGIVRGHDGAITVASELGQGSRVCVYFPQSPESADASRVISSSSIANTGDGQHILYVDDEEALVFLTTRVLERLGYRVTGRIDPKQALEEFRVDPMRFDAVVSDLSMPGITGPELAREMLAIRADIPIVLTSGYIRDEDMKLVHELGIRDLVLKPNTVEDLGATLHRLLADA